MWIANEEIDLAVLGEKDAILVECKRTSKQRVLIFWQNWRERQSVSSLSWEIVTFVLLYPPDLVSHLN